MTEVVITNNFVPPDRLVDEWDDAIEEYSDFMAAAPGLKPKRKLIALKRVQNAWVCNFRDFSSFGNH
jgi:hypothetical protein